MQATSPNQKIACPVCGANQLTPILKKKAMPLYNLELHRSRADALAAARGDLDYYQCSGCTFVFNAAFNPSLMNYKVAYNNDRALSQIYRAYMDTVCERINNMFDITGKTIVEVGCGSGEFLKQLHQKYSFRGYDPNLSAANNHHETLTFINDYYRADLAKPDLLILRHTLEHLGDPHVFLDEITGTQAPRLALAPAKRVDLYIEVPAWEWIVERNQIFAFSFEHCSYYTKPALEKTLTKHGFQTRKLSFGFKGEHLEYYGTRKN